MNVAALGVLSASLLGSVHCAAMCGGFVCFYSGNAASRDAVRGHVLYNGGRFASYVLLGALAGLLGAGVTQLGALAGIGRAATILAGILMIAWGTSTLLAARGVHVGTARAPEAWQRLMGRVLYRVRSQPVGVRALLTGLLTTMLPCGWLYVFVVAAAGTGSMLQGMFLMSVFWLGTVPALVAIGIGAQRLVGPMARRLPAVGATVIMIMGLLALAGRLQFAVDMKHHAHSAHVAHEAAR